MAGRRNEQNVQLVVSANNWVDCKQYGHNDPVKNFYYKTTAGLAVVGSDPTSGPGHNELDFPA